MLGQKKVNKANDAYKLKKAKGYSNKKDDSYLGTKNTYRPKT